MKFIFVLLFVLFSNVIFQTLTCPIDNRNLKSNNSKNNTENNKMIISKMSINATNVYKEDNLESIDLMKIMSLCNESFRVPMEYLKDFNSTGSLVDENDKTAMCYLRCYFEHINMTENGKFIPEKVKEMWWPATGDSIDVCNQEGKDEENSCVSIYYKAKCLMLRAIVDGRNKESVVR